MTEATSPAANFHEPFVGHLPGYLAANQATAPGRSLQEVYDAALMEQWRALIDSSASQDERLVHTFLERHPSLLPGAHSVDGDSGHSAFPMAVISKPKLPGLSDREPDFMWLATDSESLYPILIEIETPHKKWFHGDRAEIHSHFTHAQGQLAEWRAWFNRGHNRSAFLEHYEIPPELARRRLTPRFVLIYGRRDNYVNSQRRQEKRAELARADERLMSFDRLTPTKDGVLFSCVRKEQDGYRVVAVPPCLTIFNDGEDYQHVSGWEQALDACLDMAHSRREYLKNQLRLLTENPEAYAQARGGLRFRRPQWL
ncbi:Shedu anti-phage system protein SduA domain-containing protein [Nonomuraea jabiensis]|uniref:Shedu anti-phage system protein SduA domain-containing protein n=1 Tax=Nonomuraea jabiensis TaxID=882448 RepID=UPI0036931767